MTEPQAIETKVTRRDMRRDFETNPPSRGELRYMMDLYYQMQEFRKAGANEERANGSSNQGTHPTIEAVHKTMRLWENKLQIQLDEAAQTFEVGKWAASIVGIGGVISAGLLAHIDITQAPTVGHIWRFAGLDPTVTWGKKQKRPWNARLKTLCWHIGESFVKTSGRDGAYYGQVYAARKIAETAKNDGGTFAEQAAAALTAKKYGKDTEAYKHYSAGHLPPAHIHARAKRYAVKLFLSHWHWVAYKAEYGIDPPKPFVIEHLGHADLLRPPNWM